MDTFILRIRYESLIKDIEQLLNEHRFESESEACIANFLMGDIKEHSTEIQNTLGKLGNVLNK